MINNLKKQVNDFKQIVKTKDEEIINLKINSKEGRFKTLESEHKGKNEEIFILRDSMNKLKEALKE